MQEACLAALAQWPVQGAPVNPRGWLITTARHKARDQARWEARREAKEVAAVRELDRPGPTPGDELGDVAPEDQLV